MTQQPPVAYAINIMSGRVEWLQTDQIVIGYAATTEGDIYKLPVVSNLARFRELCRQQSYAVEAVAVHEQFGNGIWKIPLLTIAIPPRG